jgi:hypothetical protein
MSSMLLAAAAAAATATATVTPAPTVTADEALTNAQTLYRVTPPKRKPCPVASGNEIVVCAQQEDPKTQYVPSDVDNGDPTDAIPRAPDVSVLPQTGTLVVKGCFIPPCPPPAALIIDLKAIPEAPPGSDADKIARGEQAAP